MTSPQSSTDQYASALLHSLKTEQSANEVLRLTDSAGLRSWELPLAICIGGAVGAVMYFAGQPLVSALALGVATTSLNLAFACAAEMRRMNQRLNALLQLQQEAAERQRLQREALRPVPAE
jgi:predicted signal transduction protein with EAL and GGDEF domain